MNNKPLRWQAVPIAETVLSAVVMLGLAGCVRLGAETGNTPAPTMREPLPPLLEVPLFEHGNGVGVYGCVSVTAPIFLSEDDAFAIIRDEFANLELKVTPGEVKLTNIQIPKTDLSPGWDAEAQEQTQIGNFVFDFIVEGRNIAIEFVSGMDVYEWRGSEIHSTVVVYNCIEAAETLNISLNALEKEYIHAVLYDPVEPFEGRWWAPDEETRQLIDEAYARAAELLREQVKDFIAWLFAQGII
ncbi:MAG: hypothetical protein FWF10_09500 [Clostridiales bacterium]|nr:hypothetical protein [Clostridiales bacterium]